MTRKNIKNNIFIVDALRTPIGGPFKSLKKFTAVELAASVIKSITRRNKVKKGCIDEVIIGNVVSAGLGQNPARQAAITGGLQKDIPAVTINNVCGAGLQSLIMSAQSILAEDSHVVLCGGMESATHNPYFIEGDIEQCFNPRDVKDSLIHDGLQCQLSKKHMGELIEALAKQYKIKKLDQDEFSLLSHTRAVKAQGKNIFKNEIVPVKISAKKSLSKDDRPRKNITIENFQTLRPAFVRGGSVTAGNSSAPSDGAAICILASKAAVQRYQFKPKARIVEYVTVANDPKKAFEASVEAVRKVLKKAKLTIKDIDLFEISESFAAQTLFAQRKLKISTERINIYGGDLAFGHPLGAAGARIIGTLITALKKENLRRGLAVISYGGGGSTAVIIERII